MPEKQSVIFRSFVVFLVLVPPCYTLMFDDRADNYSEINESINGKVHFAFFYRGDFIEGTLQCDFDSE